MAGTAHADAPSGSGDAGAKEQPQQKAQEMRDQAGEQARQAAGQARDRVREQIDQRSTEAGERVTEQAGDLRTVAEQLRRQGKDGPARIADQTAERVQRVGAWMTESDADRILSDVEDFARRKPWAVAAGGLALGFAASRLLKASSSSRYEQRAGSSGVPGDRRLPARTGVPPSDGFTAAPAGGGPDAVIPADAPPTGPPAGATRFAR